MGKKGLQAGGNTQFVSGRQSQSSVVGGPRSSVFGRSQPTEPRVARPRYVVLAHGGFEPGEEDKKDNDGCEEARYEFKDLIESLIAPQRTTGRVCSPFSLEARGGR